MEPNMPNLILVRHSLPEINPTVTASQWQLSEEGRQRCKSLAAALAPFEPDVFYTSTEPKAIETGQLVASRLNRRVESADGLHEHVRTDVAFGSTERFEKAVGQFFAQPAQLVFGSETADQAHQRFTEAIAAVLDRCPRKTVAIVTHGTVMTLYVSRALQLEPFGFWKRLGMPAFVALSYPDFNQVTVVEQVHEEKKIRALDSRAFTAVDRCMQPGGKRHP
jgi:broad specificity phosphatase PhoE